MSAGRGPSSRARRLAEVAVLVTVLIWAANFVVVKATIGVVGPLTFTALRYVVASLTLLFVLRWRTGAISWPRGQGRVLFALGALGFGAYQLLWITGLSRITAGDSALLVATSPVLTALLAGVAGMDTLSAPRIVGALLAFGGVALVIVSGQDVGLGRSLLGDALTLAAAGLWAVYTVGGTRVLRVVDPLVATTWTVVAGTVVLVPVGAWDAVLHPPSTISAPVVVAILYSGALAAGIANVFVFNAIRFVGPTRTTTMQFLVPGFAVVLGALLLAEPVGLLGVVGGAVIVAGIWVTRRRVLVPSALRRRLAGSAS